MSMDEAIDGGHDWSMLVIVLSGSPKLSIRSGVRAESCAAGAGPPGPAYLQAVWGADP